MFGFEFLDDILQDHIAIGSDFEFITGSNGIEGTYYAMDEHMAIKALVKL